MALSACNKPEKKTLLQKKRGFFCGAWVFFACEVNIIHRSPKKACQESVRDIL